MEFTVEKKVQFAVHDKVALSGTWYSPAVSNRSADRFPALVAVHGGAWKIGQLEFYQYWGAYLASRGIGLFTIDYRLVLGAANRYPAAVHDVRAAVQFLRANAARFGVDPDRLGLVGDSAGGHLSLLVALAGDLPEFRGGYPDDPHAGVSTRVKAVVGVYGVYDMMAQWEHDVLVRTPDNITEAFLGVSPYEDRRKFQVASPLSYATTHANQTSVLLTWGKEDDIVDWTTQSAVMLTALKRAGYYVRTVVLEGAGHFWMADPIEEEHSYSAVLAPKLARFLGERL